MTNEELTQEVADLKETLLSLHPMLQALSEYTQNLGKAIDLQAGTLAARVAVSDALVCAVVQSNTVNEQVFELALKGQVESQSADLADGAKQNFKNSISNTRLWIDALK